jgi:L-ribulose-5-phosphate 4-epimerase
LGKDPLDAVHNSVVLEALSEMAMKTFIVNPDVKDMQQELLDKHFLRKHGPGAYYGQG